MAHRRLARRHSPVVGRYQPALQCQCVGLFRQIGGDAGKWLAREIVVPNRRCAVARPAFAGIADTLPLQGGPDENNAGSQAADMNLKCILGRHQWRGCRCDACGKIRDQDHVRSNDCEDCARCGTASSNSHDWDDDCEWCSVCKRNRMRHHVWQGHTCSKCGATLEFVDLVDHLRRSRLPLQPRKSPESLYDMKSAFRRGDKALIGELIALLGYYNPRGASRVWPDKELLRKVAAAIIALGGYEHADVLRRMMQRELSNTKYSVYEFLRIAIEYKLEGSDFKVVHSPERKQDYATNLGGDWIPESFSLRVGGRLDGC
jgi:hypothetical protein